MYPASFDYYRPKNLKDAVTLLRKKKDAKLLAGGHSLLPAMKLRVSSPAAIIDIGRVKGLQGIKVGKSSVKIGALTTHAEVAESGAIGKSCPLLSEAAAHIGDMQVRNRGTIGGSLAHADPAGDWPTALLALNTEVTITGLQGVRRVPLTEFIVDAYTTQLGSAEMVTEVSVPFSRRPCGGAYVKFERRAGDFAVASVAVQLELAEGDRCGKVAVSLGALGAAPRRARAAEELLRASVATLDGLQPARPLPLAYAISDLADNLRAQSRY